MNITYRSGIHEYVPPTDEDAFNYCEECAEAEDHEVHGVDAE